MGRCTLYRKWNSAPPSRCPLASAGARAQWTLKDPAGTHPGGLGARSSRGLVCVLRVFGIAGRRANGDQGGGSLELSQEELDLGASGSASWRWLLGRTSAKARCEVILPQVRRA